MNSMQTSELRIPATKEYIVVAKRAVTAFGAVAGFDVETLDDLTIAVAQACQQAIKILEQKDVTKEGYLTINFGLEDGTLRVHIRSHCPKTRVHVLEGKTSPNSVPGCDEDTRLALSVMGLFVQECQYQVNQRTGYVRIKLFANSNALMP